MENDVNYIITVSAKLNNKLLWDVTIDHRESNR